MVSRVFIPQQTIDEWLSADEVEIQGEVIVFRTDNRRLRLIGASHFLSVSGGGDDPGKLVGKVKDEAALAALGAEAYMSSVIMGETAYDVSPGFLAEPVDPVKDGGEPLRAALKKATFRTHKTASSRM